MARVYSGEKGHEVGHDPHPCQKAVKLVRIGLRITFRGEAEAFGRLRAQAFHQQAVALHPPAAVAGRVRVEGIAAQVGVGSRYLVDVHGVHLVLVGQPLHDGGKLALPYSALGTHDGQLRQAAVGLVRGIAFGIGIAALALGHQQ